MKNKQSKSIARNIRYSSTNNITIYEMINLIDMQMFLINYKKKIVHATIDLKDVIPIKLLEYRINKEQDWETIF
jgi:hypothetical protein